MDWSALIGAEYGFATATWDAGRCRQLGQKRTSIDASLMSAPPPTADVHPSLEGGWDVQVGSDGAIKLRWSRKRHSPAAPPTLPRTISNGSSGLSSTTICARP